MVRRDTWNKKTYELAFEFIKQINDKTTLRYLIIEGSYYTEVRINNYLKNGSDSSLNKFMDSHKGTIGYTQQRREYYKKIYELNKSLGAESKIRAVSIDIEHTPLNAHLYLRTKYRNLKSTDSTLYIYKINSITSTGQFYTFYNELFKDIENNKENYYSLLKADFSEFSYLVRNIIFGLTAYSSKDKDWDKIRDSLICENFKLRDKEFNFSSSRSFAYWGANHTSQQTLKKGTEFIAAKIRKFNPEIHQTTYNCLYVNCRFLFSEFEVPGIIRWLFKKEKKPYRIAKKLANSNKALIHVNGTNYLKKRAKKDIEIFLTATLPNKKDFIQGRKKDLPNKEYAQYIVLIQNSKECNSL